MVLLSEYTEFGFLTIEAKGAKSGDKLSYGFRAGVEEVADWPLEQLRGAINLSEQIDSTFFSPRTTVAQLYELAGHFASWALPPLIRSRLVDWVSADPKMESTLVIEIPRLDLYDWIADLPWELLPAGLDLDLFVVRLAGRGLPGSAREPGLERARLLVAGWPRLPNGVRLEGVMREVGQIPARFRGEALEVDGMLSPTVDDFASRVRDYEPNILHLAIANGFHVDLTNDTTALTLDPVDNGGPSAVGEPTQDGTTQMPFRPEFTTLPGKELIGHLTGIDELRACILNTMPNPVVTQCSIYREICTALGVAVVGWSGAVQDSVAVDFALYWYQRILEGAPVARAMRSFANQYTEYQWVLGGMPTLWIPSEQWLRTPLLQARESESPHAGRVSVGAETTEVADTDPHEAMPPISPSPPGPSPAPPPSPPLPAARTIEIGFSPQPSLFPSLLINRQPAIRELTLDTSAEVSCQLEIVCDAGGRASAFREIRRLKKGHNAIDVSSMEFPALYELIDSDERRIVTFAVSVSVDDPQPVAQVTRSVPWRARREWLDSEEAWPYVPAFVLPMSRAVGEVVHDAERVLAQIGNPKDRFSGYSKSKKDRIERARGQMKAIFHAVRDRGLKYITPPGSPVYVIDPAVVETDRDPHKPGSEESAAGAEGDQALPSLARVSGQLVRLPDDVLQRGHATCHDLSLLLAAAAEYVSLRPLVILLPGHTFFGLWLDDDAQNAFWKGHQTAGREVGEGWTIPQHALEPLVTEGTIMLLESTLVTNAYATFERAIHEGQKLLQRRLEAIIDIRASRREVQSLPIP